MRGGCERDAAHARKTDAARRRSCVTGAGGFIASHLAKRLKLEGHYVVGVDWKKNEHMAVRARRQSSSAQHRVAGEPRFMATAQPGCPLGLLFAAAVAHAAA